MKQFTKQEMKILVYRKMNSKGLSYDSAVKELKSEIAYFDKKQKEKDKLKKSKKGGKT